MLDERKKVLIDLIKNSYSLSEVCEKAGLSKTNGNYITLKNIINDDIVNISHFKRVSGGGKKKIDINDILVENSTYNGTRLKNRLIRDGIKDNRCECCGLTEWLGESINTEIHHVNGNHTDNRIDNLKILCPNCHSYTDNYCGKNIKENKICYCIRYCLVCGKRLKNIQKKYCSSECQKNRKLSKDLKKEDILIVLKKYQNIKQASKYFNISRNTLRRYMKLFHIYGESNK